jgi:signal transduction histidine kinase/CheY-like chemotaxis protein
VNDLLARQPAMSFTSAPVNAQIDQREMRFLVDKNADGILVVDNDGIILFANPAAEHLFGRHYDQLIGSSIGVPVVVGEMSEIAIVRPGGQKIDAEIRVVETVWDRHTAMLLSLRDVSARRIIEEQRRHSAKMEALGRLTAGIAHDFNNLLTIVLGNLETVIRSADKEKLPARSIQCVENAMRGAERAAVLTERLLAFARRKPLEPRPIDPNELLAGMSDLFRQTLGEAIELSIIPGEEVGCVEADPTELETTILNLAANARDAMPSGGRFVIETADVELDPFYTARFADLAPGAYVLFAITDTGCGMSADILSKVFEPFFTTKDDGHGTGLGLSQVYGFVKQSGGHVTIYSEPGLGTTLKVYLPRLEGHPNAARALTEERDAQSARAFAGSSKETILVVEDDLDVRNHMVSSLQELGYHVLQASDGSSGLELIKREPSIRLLLTDLGLPGGIDGRKLSEQARKRRPTLKVLLTTAYAAAALVHDGKLDAGVELLSKPFTFLGLAKRVRKLLDEPQQSPRILVVEDELLVRMLITDVLMEAGCEVEEAANATEALRKFNQVDGQFDAALIDIGLPDMRGDRLFAKLREKRPEVPVVLATGAIDTDTYERFSRIERLQIVSKPFNHEALKAALHSLGIHLHQDS